MKSVYWPSLPRRMLTLWKYFLYECDLGKPPWHDMECIRFLCVGDKLSVFVRQGYLPDGTLLQLADLCHRDIHNGTITLLPIRDLPELIELLTNTLESIETKDPSQNN